MSEINMVTEVESGTASQERKSSHLDILVRLPNLFPKFKTWLFLSDTKNEQQNQGDRARGFSRLASLLQRNDVDGFDALRELIDDKVKNEDCPLEATCHLNDNIVDEQPVDERKDKAIIHVIEMREVEDGKKSLIDLFFNGDQDIEDKLESLKSEEWTEKELKCFYRIFLTAAAREKRHDIVDVMLHLIRRQMIDTTELHNTILTYSVANHEDDTFRKTPLQWAVENHDIFSLIELLRIEKLHHECLEDGLYCLKHQLTNDLNLNLAISQFNSLYPKSSCEHRMEALPVLIPLLISFILYCIDVRGDISLSVEYRNYSLSGTPANTNGTGQDCSNWSNRTITSEMYGKAFKSSAIFASSSLVTALFLVLVSKNLRPLCNNLWRRSRWRFALLMPLSICPPLFLFMIYLIYTYRHSTSSKKSKERKELEQAEFLWNIVDTVEAGFEASGEILLQVWLLGPKILEITSMGIKEFMDGILFLKGATDTQKSLGKVIIAIISIVYSVGECYRVQKREAVNMFFDIFPVYTSILLQVIARVIAFSMFFSSTQGSGEHLKPGWNGGQTFIFLSIHIFAVFAIKLRLSRHWWGRKHMGRYEFGMKVLADLLSAVCSVLVYSNIRPLMANERKDREGKEDFVNRAKEDHKYSTTFFAHFYFFVLVLVENIVLTAWPFITTVDCYHIREEVGKTWAIYLVLIVVALTVASGLSDLFYYTCYGHPWTAINGRPMKMRLREIHKKIIDIFRLCCCKNKVGPDGRRELGVRMPQEAE